MSEELEQAKLAGTNVISQFVFGGNSTFTVVSKRTSARFTYKVAAFQEMFIVKVLYGPDNENDYRQIGKVVGGIFSLTNKARMAGITMETNSVSVFTWMLRNLGSNNFEEKIEIWHAGRCGRCGRKLTVPESIFSGYGSECLSKL